MDLGDGTAGMGRGAGADLVAQLLLARGVPPADLERQRNPSLRAFLPDPSHFRDMDTAAERLAAAVITGEAVTVYGDYDVDGATSAALLIRLLRELGLQPGYYIPDRLLEGYGPSGEALVRIGAEGSQLIVTVDCGAMAHEALAMAADAGIEVIVVDHHKCSAELPRTAALVNPNRLAALADWLDDRLGQAVSGAMANQALALDLGLTPRGLTPDLIADLESAGPFGMGWPAPRVAVGPGRVVQADTVGTDHVRLIVRGDDGASFKAIAFRTAQSEMGQTLLHGTRDRRLWLAGRVKIDDWASRPQAELHIEDAAFVD